MVSVFPVSLRRVPEDSFTTVLHNVFLLAKGTVPHFYQKIAYLCPSLLLLSIGINVCAIVQGVQWMCTLKTSLAKLLYVKAGNKIRTPLFTRNSGCSSQHAATTSEANNLNHFVFSCQNLFYLFLNHLSPCSWELSCCFLENKEWEMFCLAWCLKTSCTAISMSVLEAKYVECYIYGQVVLLCLMYIVGCSSICWGILSSTFYQDFTNHKDSLCHVFITNQMKFSWNWRN